MLRALEHFFRALQNLLRIIECNLSDRELTYVTKDGPGRKKITAAVAQGSILGPDLWNVSYDGILQMEIPPDSFLVGYAEISRQ